MNRRAWKHAIPIALAAVYLPTLVPFAVGSLTTSSHSVTSYFELLPIVPTWMVGAVVAKPFASDMMALYACSGIATAALLVGMLCAARRLRMRDLTALCIVTTPLVGIQAHVLGIALRA